MVTGAAPSASRMNLRGWSGTLFRVALAMSPMCAAAQQFSCNRGFRARGRLKWHIEEMSLEDEARRFLLAKEDAALARRQREASEEVPVVPEWTAELMAQLRTRYPEHPVYRFIPHTPRGQPAYELMGRGWLLSSRYYSEGYTAGVSAVLLTDRTLRDGYTVTHNKDQWVGIESFAGKAIVAGRPLIHSGNAAGPEPETYRIRLGVFGITALLSGEIEVVESVKLKFWDPRGRG